MAREKCYIATLVILILACIGLLGALLYLEFGRKQAPAPTTTPETAAVAATTTQAAATTTLEAPAPEVATTTPEAKATVAATVTTTIAASTSKDDTRICITKDCALTASSLISAMDTSVDPCEDFYQFSCGNFIESNPVKEEEISFTLDDVFKNKFELQLLRLIEEWKADGEPNVVFRLQEAYHVCINTSYQRQKEFAAFKNFTKNILDLPLAAGKNWTGKHQFLGHYLGLFEQLGLHNPLVKIQIDTSEEDPSKYVAYISPAVILSSWFSWLSDDAKTDAQKIMKLTNEMLMKVLKLLGNDDEDSIKRQLFNVVRLVNYIDVDESEDEEEDDDDEDSDGNTDDDEHGVNEEVNDYDEEYDTDEDEGNTLTFEELYNLTSRKIHWLNIVNKKMHFKAFSATDEVYVQNLPYFEKLGEAAKKFRKRHFVNLFGLEIFLRGILKHAGPDVDRILKEYVSGIELYEKTELFDDVSPLFDKEYREQPRWRFCLETVKDIFNLVLTRLFIQKYIEKDEKQSADQVIQLIQKAYRRNIENSDWLDEETKDAALRKADKMKRFVGYPDAIFDSDGLDKIYENVLPQVKSTHFDNYRAFLSASAEREIPPIDETEHEIHTWKWESSPLDVNAFYLPHKNSIWFPYAHLQLPYFQDNRLAAVNFGMVGSVIGHEVGHAFDDSGSERDENGREHNWWTNTTKDIYDNKSDCFREQYSAFCPEELQSENEDEKTCVNGDETVGENLADNSGLEAAFLAYKSWIETYGPEKRLPGLQEFTPEQLFFISFGYAWCENIAPDKWLYRYEDDSHSPARYRVIGGVANSQSFRETFNCPEGPMNRGKNSCTVW